MPSLCRDCLTSFDAGRRCPTCGRPRILSHPELFRLSIAHMDCDAFYASVEKRDNPELRDKPLIIGGGARGVVATACYLARIKGVRSAMPMFQARKLCPEAVVIPGRMARYVEISQKINGFMSELTPLVEPLSLDEAFLDLTGTARVHGAPPAVMLARLVRRMKEEIGITGSIGLSHNKFLAKIASDLDKPHGFSVIGKSETQAFLAPQPIEIIWGIGPAAKRSLNKAGIHTIEDLTRWPLPELTARFGSQGERLWHLARGQDTRAIKSDRRHKSISNETTFSADISDIDPLDGHLWRMSEKCAGRAKAKQLVGNIVTLKLKRHDHTLLTRRSSLRSPTHMADTIYRQARSLLDTAINEGPFRLLGVGLSDLEPNADQLDTLDLLDPDGPKRRIAEKTTDAIRAKFGPEAIIKGRSLR